MNIENLLKKDCFGLESSNLIEKDYEFDYYGYVINRIISFSYDYETEKFCLDCNYIYHLGDELLIKSEINFFIYENDKWIEKKLNYEDFKLVDKFMKLNSSDYVNDVLENVDSEENQEDFRFYKSLKRICENSEI